MIYHPSFTPTTEHLREIVESPERDFPHTAMDTDLSNFRDRGSPWHWHECFELFHVRVKAMLRFIHGHFAESLGVAEIAAAGISERECCRCFAAVLDDTPMRYLARHRIAESARLLAETGASVSHIAEACGFSSPGYFGKVFRAAMGVSPGTYRRGGD